MARVPRSPEAARAARNVRIGVIAIVVVALAAAALWYTGRLGTRGVSAAELERVLLVAAAPDETGDVVAQVIAIVDVSGAAPEAVDPATAVTLPGTTYATLADAYPFGGGSGVAEALARARGGDPLPHVTLSAAALTAAVEAAGGVSLELPADMSVFDGEELFILPKGSQELTARELGAVLKGVPYLTVRERAELNAELARVTAALVADCAYTDVETDLEEDAFAALTSALAEAR
ncbi:MAG: hypothetical protein AAGU73_08780 [Actinomycetota bacterium]